MKDVRKSKKLKGGGLVWRIVPYLVVFALVLVLMIVGSEKGQRVAVKSTFLSVIADNDFTVTADQLSESYIVADMANALSLPSANSVSENYVSVAMRYETTGALDTGIIEKPNIIDTSDLARGVKEYVVKAGESLAVIAARLGLTTTQLRWSNGMKNETVQEGQVLYYPTVAGILYTVKAGETIEGLAEKYQSDAEQIRILNDLETTGAVAGQTIILPGGVLPEKERPEYVPPTVVRPGYGYTTLTDSGARHNITQIGSYSYWRYTITPGVSGDGNRSTEGQCTWFAWYWRRYNMPANYWLPSEPIGNARDWVVRLQSRYRTNRTPAVGAVIQTQTSGYGHVGVVTNVVAGEYIVIEEMNFFHRPYTVYRSTIYWDDAARFYYIHEAY